MDRPSAFFDPEPGRTAFALGRITCTRSRTGTASRSYTARAMGCVHPGISPFSVAIHDSI